MTGEDAVTVGIVLVSHSAELARGTAALAHEMAEGVPVEPAGGLDEPGEPLGTDAARVADAIGRADSGAGVLVLMDLGSAVLSAELALEFVGDVQVELCAAPLVEGAVAAAVAAQAGGALAEVAAEALRGLDGKRAQLGAGQEEQPGAAPPEDTGDADARLWRRAQLEVTNPLGLHGRPAARVVRTVAGFTAEVRITDLTSGHGPVSARSLASLISLGTVGGHRVEVSATGTDAGVAIDALRRLAAEGFGDEPATVAAAEPVVAARDLPAGAAFRGLAAAPGSVLGRVRHLRLTDAGDPDAVAGAPQEEAARLRAAVGEVRRELTAARDDAARTLGAAAADILAVQELLVEDDALLGAALSRVDAGTPAGRAWREAIADVVAGYLRIEDAYQRARADDVEDVGRRVAAALAGVPPRRTVAGAGVVVADALGPADTVGLDRDLTHGILTASGTPAGHAAILARALGIPAVVAAGEDALRLAEEELALVDGDTGAVYVRPDDAVQREHERRRAAAERARSAAVAAAGEPAVTETGERVAVHANVGSRDDAVAAGRSGADGVGLLRTEFLFLDRQQPPSEDEQVDAYGAVLAELPDAPVTVRTLDAGADKPLPYLRQAREENPFLGVRGLRLGLARPDLLLTQLRAILRLAAERRLRVMFPMVSSLDELTDATELLDRACAELGAERRPPVGVMVEVPAAAWLADAFAERVDFLSIGTNDLTQYVLAADRGNAGVAELGDACHPAVLGLVRRAAQAATRRHRGISVCGELAGDPAVTALLLGLGVTELSVVPSAVPLVKQAVRATSWHVARRLADRALAAASAAEVRALLPVAP